MYKWSLSVNTSKTKIVVFRNGGKVNANEKWFYDNKEIKLLSHTPVIITLF
jgi:hypothetical protein